ncbi:MAG: Hpt domain-containing protein, partial [Aquabacterium sp.]|nr:Hpt domain-containing protein [Aquabacterium sp.]
MNLDTALQAFIVESRDLLEGMEQALLQIEREPDDPETINAIFRAAHTIKGSAGIFGLDDIVAFTHVAESVLDQARGGTLRFDGELANLFLSVCDHIRALVEQVAGGSAGAAGAAASGDVLVARMQAVLTGGCPSASAALATTAVVGD